MTNKDLRMSPIQDQWELCDFDHEYAPKCSRSSAFLSSFHSAKIILNNQLISFLSNINSPAGIKDLNSCHIFCNKRYLSLGNIPKDYIYRGKSDGELPTLFSNFESEFQQQDRYVIETGKSIKILDVHPYGKENIIKPMLFHKFPCFNEDENCVGTIYLAEDATHQVLLSQQITRNLFFDGKIMTTVLLGRPNEIISKYEWEVVYLLVNGSNLKEISSLLNKGYSTVRGYQQDAISKLNNYGVYNAHQLKDFVFCLGWQQYVPERFLVQKSILLSI